MNRNNHESIRSGKFTPNPPQFMEAGFKLIGRNINNIQSEKTRDRIFRANFGTSSKIASIVWKKIVMYSIAAFLLTAHHTHFLWALHFLKNYNSENVSASFAGVDEKTWRLWTWRMIIEIHNLHSRVVRYTVKLYY